MIDERSAILLKTLIERYISDGMPVGSRLLAKSSPLELSPASIRNIMSDLEELGLISSPHTSSGRVPTNLGYRMFVDSLLQVKPLDKASLSHLKDSLQPSNTEKLISSASKMLSELSNFAGIVLSPKRESTVFKHIEFIQLSQKKILLIIVAPNGDVHNQIIMSEKTYTSSELNEAGNYLNKNFAGMTFDKIKKMVNDELIELKFNISELMNHAIRAGSDSLEEKNNYSLSGESKLLNVQGFSENMQNLKKLFNMFEQKSGLLQLLDSSNQAKGVKIYIGEESELTPLEACSVVTSTYKSNGEIVGTLGVIGPTRMSYDRVIPIVDITAKVLSSVMSKS